MRNFDRIASIIIISILAPVILMLSFWWGSIPFVENNDQLIFYLAISGFVVGMILDVTILRRFLLKLFSLSLLPLVAIEIFYSIMVYGFFMGFPAFNSLVGILGSYIVARKCVYDHASQKEAARNVKYMLLLSTVILFAVCICSAFLALRETTICSQVRGMLNLSFEVTIEMIWGLILIGGSMLLIVQYYISKLVCRKVLADLD
jgi:hypothetical protein